MMILTATGQKLTRKPEIRRKLAELAEMNVEPDWDLLEDHGVFSLLKQLPTREDLKRFLELRGETR